MARDPRYDILFEPVKIGPVTARNRFYQVPHCNGMGRLHPTSMAVMRGVKAEGGWAVVSTEQCDIHPTTETGREVRLWDERDIPTLARMTELVHRHGSLASIELTHMGYHASNMTSREVPMAPSARPVEGINPIHARAMTKADIADYRRWHRRAALNAKKAGFDIVCVYAAHDLSLLMHFLSPRHNQRRDEYGGSMENRARLLREVIEDTKEAVGDTMGVVVRFAVDELMGEKGILAERGGPRGAGDAGGAARPLGRQLQRLGQRFDHLPLLRGRLPGALHRLRQAVHLEAGGRSGALHLPGPDGEPDPQGHARHDRRRPALDRGPLPAEEDRGGPHRGHPRVHRVQHLRGRRQPQCTHALHPEPDQGRGVAQGLASRNASLPASGDERVLVVGAGPAGLEAARALGQRGYEVVLAEAGTELGGRVAFESRLPGLAAWGRVRDWRVGQLHKLPNVEVYRVSRLDAAQVCEAGCPLVALATGSTWRRDGVGRHHEWPMPGALDFSGAGAYARRHHAGVAVVQSPVVVFDDDHYYMGGVIAEKLAAEGHMP